MKRKKGHLFAVCNHRGDIVHTCTSIWAAKQFCTGPQYIEHFIMSWNVQTKDYDKYECEAPATRLSYHEAI